MNIIHRARRKKLENYMTEWLEQTKKPTLKPSSYARIEVTCKHQIFSTLGSTRLCNLSPALIQTTLNELSEQRSYSTVKKAYNNLYACLDFAVLRGDLDHNPARTVVLPSNRQIHDISSYSQEQIHRIVKEATSCYKNGRNRYRYGWAIILLLNTGLRVGELLYLKWKDVNIEQHYIYVHGDVSVVRSEEHYQIIEQDSPKTARSNRYVVLNNNAIQALEKLKVQIGDTTRVVATKNSTLVSPRKIHTTMMQILKRCGIEGAKDIVHALRHTFATALIRQGTDIKIVSELLGHSDVGTTLRIYYHTIEEQKHAAVTVLEDFY
jgi:integrase